MPVMEVKIIDMIIKKGRGVVSILLSCFMSHVKSEVAQFSVLHRAGRIHTKSMTMGRPLLEIQCQYKLMGKV